MGAANNLTVRDLTVRFGGIVANNDISLQAEPGRIVGLIGPNGAGKTTFINAVTGFVRSEGQVFLGTKSLSGEPPFRRRRWGLSRTWQAGELFDSLTVLDNVRVAADCAGLSSLVRDFFTSSQAGYEEAQAILDRVGLAHFADCYPAELSLGQKRLAGVARALAGTPSVLLLDEPAAGLSRTESDELGHHLKSIAASGICVVLVDHDVRLVFEVAEQVYVLDFGTLIAQGPPEDVKREQAVIDAYLGAAFMERSGDVH